MFNSKEIKKDKDVEFKRVEFISVEDDKTVLELANKIMLGIPLCLNFDECLVEEANQVVSFLSGVIYALDGVIQPLSKKIFLLAQKSSFKDGSLNRFIEQYKEE